MATTTNFGWETPDDTDLVKDGAAAMRTLGSAIDTSLVDLKGGTTGQVLSKATNTDMDFTWVTPNDADAIQNSIIDAKGDLISATAADTPERLAVGTNGQFLTVDSTTATGLKWASLPDISCRLVQTGGTNLSTTFASIAFASENFDTDTMHDNVTNNTRITIKTPGKYNIGGQVTIGNNAALGARLLVNGTTVIARQYQGNSSATESANLSTIYDFSLNDYIELQGAVASGTATTSADGNTNFWAVKL